jgi:cobalt/nickel transport protein
MVGLVLVLMAGGARAHFGMVIPSDNMVMAEDARRIDLVLSFSHPMEMVGMALGQPTYFKVWANGQEQDLRAALKPAAVMDQPAWQATYAVKRPGVYVFVMEPQPYWEPAEDVFIIHYTKTVVAAFGDDEGWDTPVGLETEIVPLSKPYGLYAGNLFQGVVKLKDQPVPYAAVEVEYYNQDMRAQAPTDFMVTQTVKADANGVFSYAAPRAGWWGFAALNTAGYKLPLEGQDKDVELGAVIWVKFEAWQGN